MWRGLGTVLTIVILAGTPLAAETNSKLSIRVLDAGNGQPIAARLVVRTADGKFPGDRIGLASEKWPNIEAHGVFLAGETTLTLPAGQTLVIASAGPQYTVERKELELTDGNSQAIELVLRRRIDLRKQGWVAGDAHLHMIHGEMQRATSYDEVATVCRACGLDWAYVGQEYVGAGESTLAQLQAQCDKASHEQFKLLLGGERPKSLLGHNALIGVTDPFVIPDDPPYHLAARQIHQQGGVLFPVHPVRYYPGKQYLGEWLDFPGNNLGRELIFDSYLGPSFDGLSVLSDEPNHASAVQLWFNLLNKGNFVPVFADSDACFDRPVLHKNVPGFWATYLYVGQASSVDNRALAEAVRQGRTMATTGPLVMWNIAGKLSGDTLPPDGQTREVTIDVLHAHHNWTLADARISKVELLRNGKVVRVWEPNTPDAKLSLAINEQEPCWYVVRAFGDDARWQVGLTSPIYFAEQPAARKQTPRTVRVRGRVYDFATGKEQAATITVTRANETLASFQTGGQFLVAMPLDATLTATDQAERTLSHDLLLDYAPVHRFLSKLDSAAMGKPETLEQFEAFVKEVDLEFPLGHRLSGCYEAKPLSSALSFTSLKARADFKAPAATPAVAMILLDKKQVSPGDEINVALVCHNVADKSDDPLLVVECRGYDARRPSGFNPLKIGASLAGKWSQAQDAGDGYRALVGKLKVPDWVEAGPVQAVEINALVRAPAGKFLSHVGLRIPLGPTSHALMVTSNWPTVPISWPDHNYGIGPLKVCGKLGRQGQPALDYRELLVEVATSTDKFRVHPQADCIGCADADDAVFAGHFYDQILNDEAKLLPTVSMRAQPTVVWRQLPLIDATQATK